MGECNPREIRGMQVYNVSVWMAAAAMYAQIHSKLSICDKTTPSLCRPPFLSSGSSVVLRETIGKVSHFLCRAIAPQLLVSAPLPSLLALSLSFIPFPPPPSLEKFTAATCWLN